MSKPLSVGAQELKKLVDRGELAKRLDCSRQAISSWLMGDAIPSPTKMAQLETIYGIPMRAWTEGAELEEEAPTNPANEPPAGPKTGTVG
jgi:transcriptional regulator with XRE-family HTH domain